ncbi:DUF1028 domain-containing protein [Micromonospora sp. U56]|uniref:DUF1028 domain-containing protein n=1 Tax=Micromonospora sp. U56 TaxID=2824900 RepID=UPI0035A8BAB8
MPIVTFSIAARCPRTGQLGVGALTARPAVGKLVAHVHSGGARAAAGRRRPGTGWGWPGSPPQGPLAGGRPDRAAGP